MSAKNIGLFPLGKKADDREKQTGEQEMLYASLHTMSSLIFACHI